jgi:ribosomal protein S27E
MTTQRQQELIGKFVRTCQECGHKQIAKEPPTGKEPTPSYCNSKCKACQSMSLDYGSVYQMPDEDWLR